LAARHATHLAPGFKVGIGDGRVLWPLEDGLAVLIRLHLPEQPLQFPDGHLAWARSLTPLLTREVLAVDRNVRVGRRVGRAARALLVVVIPAGCGFGRGARVVRGEGDLRASFDLAVAGAVEAYRKGVSGWSIFIVP
jgi:hypothetical protein